LAHTTWFFENFILKKHFVGYKPFNEAFDYLFNSYYQSQGKRVDRDMRGYHPRPLLSEVKEYRTRIDMQVSKLIAGTDDVQLLSLIELGIQHEQQHQELLITDLKYIWSFSPLYPVYQSDCSVLQVSSSQLAWLRVDEGIYETGNSGQTFHYDNESPRHKVYLSAFEIATRPVTVGEYLEFMMADGYEHWEHWLHEGWQWVMDNEIKSPLYWKKIGNDWYTYTLQGFKRINHEEIVTHISFYEADAYARWKGLRLPSEQEWEVAASLYGQKDQSQHFMDHHYYHPTPVADNDKAFLGQVWEWTNSAYLPYPGFKPWGGDIGEYNGKFMVNQMVLRGGSCVTPQNHIRLSYRNFFHPHLRWQFTGIRLAKDIIAKDYANLHE
jgi:ergothioneine biosynthesis protein EgtB